jgi:hypothetical protein
MAYGTRALVSLSVGEGLEPFVGSSEESQTAVADEAATI